MLKRGHGEQSVWRGNQSVRERGGTGSGLCKRGTIGCSLSKGGL